MKNMQSFEEFVNESIVAINEKLDISDDLKKVKTPEDLQKSCLNKYLVIHSRHDFLHLNKQFPQMWIVSGFEKGRISVASVGYSVFGSDIDKFAYNSTGYGIKISIDDVFKFFMFNRKRGNRIYSCDEFSITDEMQEIASRFKANRVEIDSLLTYDVTHDVGKKNVATGGYVVAGEGQSHGERYIELTVKGQDYTYRYNVYSYNPRFEKGRSTARAGWESNQTIYRVDAKTCVRLHNIFDENVAIYKDAIKTLGKFYKDEQINPK